MLVIDNKRKFKLGINLVALALLITAIIYLSLRFTPQVVDLFQRRQDLKEYIGAKGITGVLIFIFFQVFQVVVAAVPGEIVQVAGGYIYGTFWGAVFLVIGVIIGSVIDFFAARFLGFGLVKALTPEKKLNMMYQLISGPKSELVMFLLFLLPGLPKDILTYVAGLTPVRPVRFLIIAITARLPALLVSSYIGASLQRENNTVAIAALGIAVIMFVIGLLLKDKIINAIRKLPDS